MENKYLFRLRKAVTDFFKDEDVKIVLFGSRARKDNHSSSDVDIGIASDKKDINKKISFLKDKIDGMNIPYKIEIVSLSEVSEDFKNEVLKDAVIWKDCN